MNLRLKYSSFTYLSHKIIASFLLLIANFSQMFVRDMLFPFAHDVDVDEAIGAKAMTPGLPDFGRHLVFN
jgi:hypothetical protein